MRASAPLPPRIIVKNLQPFVTDDELIRFFDELRAVERQAAEVSDATDTSGSIIADEGAGEPPVPPIRISSLLVAMLEMTVPKTYSEALTGVKALSKLQFIKLESDLCVYKHADQEVFLLIYDGIVFGRTVEQCREVADALNKDFKVRLMSGEMFL